MRYDSSKIGGWDYESRRKKERREQVQRSGHHAEMSRLQDDPNSPDACPDCGYTGWKGRRCYGRGRGLR